MDAGVIYLLPNAIAATAMTDVLPEKTLQVARQLTYFIVEASKSARHALKAMGHPQPIASLTLVEMGHDPQLDQVDRWLAPVLAGQDVGILSESGCPGIADPGSQVVRRAHVLGIRVVPLVGPSSIVLALMASGLDGQRFAFGGYLPQDRSERLHAIQHFEARSSHSETQLFIETPYRNQALLDALLEGLQPSTLLLIAQDVTGPHESIRMMSVRAWRDLPISAKTLQKCPTLFGFLAQGAAAKTLRYGPNAAGGPKGGAGKQPAFKAMGAHDRHAKPPRHGQALKNRTRFKPKSGSSGSSGA